MAGTTVVNPPPITIAANNWFHAGWLDGALALDERAFDSPDHPVRDTDIEAYKDGYNMAVQSGFRQDALVKTIYRMRALDQLVISVGYK